MSTELMVVCTIIAVGLVGGLGAVALRWYARKWHDT